MENKLLLAIIVGTRPEIIKLSEVIKNTKKLFNTYLIHTGQNYDYELNDIFYDDLSIDKPDYYLNCSKENIGLSIGDIISKSYNLFLQIKPNAILILGDTNSCLCSYSAKRLKIPIFHMEAGNRCFDKNVPEEINRKIIDNIADINICYTLHAKLNLLKEGFSQKYIFICGSPMYEILNKIKYKIHTSSILNDLKLNNNDFFLFSFHREENIDNDFVFNQIIDCIYNMSIYYDKKIVISTHPRTMKKINDKNIKFNSNVILSKPFGLINYINLEINAICTISDSGSITEESNILKFKAILLRSSTERPEGIDEGSILISNTKWKNLNEAIQYSILKDNNRLNISEYYNNNNVSDIICNLILSYTNIINFHK